MCGIFGITDVSRIDRNLFQEALHLLEHRGPDATGVKYWREVAFGFTRLAIQDLSVAGNQPMTHASVSLHIVFNGEIYNYQELRIELIDKGSNFFSHSDTEVILHAYDTWGWEGMLARLEGMFGLALYDEQERKIFLARDRFGMKPLFYRICQQQFIFASEIKAILKYVGRAEVDFWGCLNPLFTTGLSPKGTTIFKTIQELEPGHFLEYDLRERTLNTKQYFHLSEWVSQEYYQELNSYSESKICELYSGAFTDSIQHHLLSDAPLASLFSAGLDSSLVSAIACRVDSFSLYYFESETQDDVHYAQDFSKTHASHLKIFKGGDSNYILEIPKLIYHYENINKQEGPVLAKLCRHARKDGIKVLLTGDASDELFGGYPTHNSFLIRSMLHNITLTRKILQIVNTLFRGVINLGIHPVATDYFMTPPGLSFLEVPVNCLFNQGTRLEDWQKALQTYAFMENQTEREVSAYLFDEIAYRLQRFMLRADRFGMMESVELRLPFLASSIVKLALNSPLKWRIRMKYFRRGCDYGSLAEGKIIVRKLAKRFDVPHSIIYRRKIGTPYNTAPSTMKILKNWDLNNVSELLHISPNRLRTIALESYDPALERIRYGFLATELLIRMFIHNESHENLSEQFKAILHDTM